MTAGQTADSTAERTSEYTVPEYRVAVNPHQASLDIQFGCAEPVVSPDVDRAGDVGETGGGGYYRPRLLACSQCLGTDRAAQQQVASDRDKFDRTGLPVSVQTTRHRESPRQGPEGQVAAFAGTTTRGIHRARHGQITPGIHEEFAPKGIRRLRLHAQHGLTCHLDVTGGRVIRCSPVPVTRYQLRSARTPAAEHDVCACINEYAALVRCGTAAVDVDVTVKKHVSAGRDQEVSAQVVVTRGHDVAGNFRVQRCLYIHQPAGPVCARRSVDRGGQRDRSAG